MPRPSRQGARAQYPVSYAGQMTAEDRTALRQRGCVPDANGFEVLSPNRRGEWSPTAYQRVYVTAARAEDARKRVIEALGREPNDLRAWRAL